MAGGPEERSQLPHPARSVSAANVIVVSILFRWYCSVGTEGCWLVCFPAHKRVFKGHSGLCSELMSSSSPKRLAHTESDGSLPEFFRKLPINWLCK